MESQVLKLQAMLFPAYHPEPTRVFAVAGRRGTKMLDLPGSSQHNVSRGIAACTRRRDFIGAFLCHVCCWRAALLSGLKKNYILGVWSQRGGFLRVIGDVLSDTGG